MRLLLQRRRPLRNKRVFREGRKVREVLPGVLLRRPQGPQERPPQQPRNHVSVTHHATVLKINTKLMERVKGAARIVFANDSAHCFTEKRFLPSVISAGSMHCTHRCETLKSVDNNPYSRRLEATDETSASNVARKLQAWKESRVVAGNAAQRQRRTLERKKTWQRKEKWRGDEKNNVAPKWMGDEDNDETPKWKGGHYDKPEWKGGHDDEPKCVEKETCTLAPNTKLIFCRLSTPDLRKDSCFFGSTGIVLLPWQPVNILRKKPLPYLSRVLMSQHVTNC